MSTADTPGYPTEVQQSLCAASVQRFESRVQEHGPGKHWLDDEPRWHIWKACDELFQARDAAQAGDEATTMAHMADALNHMLFAIEIVQHHSQ